MIIDRNYSKSISQVFHYGTEWSLLRNALVSFMHPLLRQLFILLPHLSQILVYPRSEIIERYFLSLFLVLAEKSNRVAEGVVSVLLSVEWISDVLATLPQSSEVLHVLLHLEVAMVRPFVLREPLDLFLIALIVAHLTNIRFNIGAPFECFTLFFPVTCQHLL